MTKERNTALDLFRCLIMFMIVVAHSGGHGLRGATFAYFSLNYFVAEIMQSFIVVHVDCFVLLSGYLGYGK